MICQKNHLLDQVTEGERKIKPTIAQQTQISAAQEQNRAQKLRDSHQAGRDEIATQNGWNTES